MNLIEIDKVKTLKEVTLEMIEFIFFMAMQVGWASGKAQSHTAPLLPGYKVIPFDYEDFHVLDAYSIPHSGKSDGFTKIWFKDFPIWTISYGGHYPKEVIPFLKMALMENYLKQIFNGGRGPEMFGHSDFPELNYYSSVKGKNSFFQADFSQFSGKEVIMSVEQPGKTLGFHRFYGMSLI